MTNKLVIVNTGCANISSVRYAIERMGYTVEVSDNVETIKSADKVFLPGVVLLQQQWVKSGVKRLNQHFSH